ncbi:hypothetical protein D3C86_1609320 [compost metagenome]
MLGSLVDVDRDGLLGRFLESQANETVARDGDRNDLVLAGIRDRGRSDDAASFGIRREGHEAGFGDLDARVSAGIADSLRIDRSVAEDDFGLEGGGGREAGGSVSRGGRSVQGELLRIERHEAYDHGVRGGGHGIVGQGGSAVPRGDLRGGG